MFDRIFGGTLYDRIEEPEERREPLPAHLRSRVIREKGKRCWYCDQMPQYPNNPLELDHVVPYWYLLKTGRPLHVYDNLVPSCERCNLIKGGKLFNSFDEARKYVRDELRKREPFNPQLDEGLLDSFLLPLWILKAIMHDVKEDMMTIFRIG